MTSLVPLPFATPPTPRTLHSRLNDEAVDDGDHLDTELADVHDESRPLARAHCHADCMGDKRGGANVQDFLEDVADSVAEHRVCFELLDNENLDITWRKCEDAHEQDFEESVGSLDSSVPVPLGTDC